jgi:hypothetical protein
MGLVAFGLRSSTHTPVIYEVVRRIGDEEMVRPIVWWSGVAAGISMSFSLLTQAVRGGW